MPKIHRVLYTAFLLVFLPACGLRGNAPPPSPPASPAPLASPTAPPAPVDTPTSTPQSQVGAPLVPSPPATATASRAENSVATETPTATAPLWPYQVQAGMPRYLPNLFHGDQSCNWMGVGGQVLDVQGAPVRDFLVVEVTGRIAGLPVSELTAVGMAPAYGEAGFEITLAKQPLGSTGALRIRLYDASLNPLSEAYTFDTRPTCDASLVLINFTANPAGFPTPTPTLTPTSTPFVPAAYIYLPIVIH